MMSGDTLSLKRERPGLAHFKKFTRQGGQFQFCRPTVSQQL